MSCTAYWTHAHTDILTAVRCSADCAHTCTHAQRDGQQLVVVNGLSRVNDLSKNWTHARTERRTAVSCSAYWTHAHTEILSSVRCSADCAHTCTHAQRDGQQRVVVPAGHTHTHARTHREMDSSEL